jgi:hypothetical protein
MTTAVHFVSGFLTACYAVAALFFVKFWRESRDRLFGFFAIGFAILAVQRALLVLMQSSELLYGLRLIAFLLIVVAIVEKNRSA